MMDARRITATPQAGLLMLGIVTLAGCGLSASSPAGAGWAADMGVTSVDMRLPREYREVLTMESELIGRTRGLLASGGDSQAVLRQYADDMRQYNDRLTAILADQIMQTSADGPPIKRINAWSSIAGILDYANLAALNIGDEEIKAAVDRRYDEIVESGRLELAVRFLHTKLPVLEKLLGDALATEKSENVKSAAEPVVRKIRAAMAAK